MTEALVCGIDVGLSGAIAWLWQHNAAFAGVIDMPVMANGRGSTKVKQQVDPWALAAMLRKMRPALVVIEQVSTMPKQGVASNGSLMHSLGTIQAVAATLGIPMQMAAPPTWKKHFGLLRAEKDASRVLAMQYWPAADLQRKYHHGRAEALLLARYGIDRQVQSMAA